MCLSPRYIINRSSHFDASQPLKIAVPCGRCDECASQAKNDWFVRCWMEHLHGGNVISFFYTLTFNNEHLPKFGDIPVFSKRVCQLFLKRLRYYLGKGVRMKYFLTSEFGEKYGRPHHHVCFFLDTFINPFVFYKMVQKAWSYGFVKYGDNAGVIYGYKGIQYVCKYVTKDFMYTDSFETVLCKRVFSDVLALYERFRRLYRINYPYFMSLRDNKITWKYCVYDYSDCGFRAVFIDDLFRELHPDDKMLPVIDKLTTKFRRLRDSMMPFHLQSTGLGSQYARELVCPVDELPILEDAGVRKYAIPRYYRRIFWYDCVENENDGKRTRFVLSEAGKQHLLESLDDDIKHCRDKALQALGTDVSRCDEDFLKDVNCRIPVDYEFLDVRDLSYFLSHVDLDLDVLAKYVCVFRGRLCYQGFEAFPLSESVVKDSYFDFVQYHLYYCADYDLGKVYQNKSLCGRLESCLFDHHPFFQPYEFLWSVLTAILGVSSDYMFRRVRDDEVHLRHLKELYKT